MTDDPNQPTLPAWAPRSRATPFEELPNNSEKIWDAARSAFAPEPTRPPTPRAVITKLFGRGPRGGLNTKAAAEAFGVSQRTVQKWVHDRKTPKSEAGEKLQSSFRRWQNESPRGRRSVLGRKTRDQLAAAPRFTVTGELKISGDVRRRNNMQVIIDEKARAAWGQMIDHLAEGNDTAAHKALESVISDSGSWGGSVEIKLEDLNF